jgi:hypothetical protein
MKPIRIVAASLLLIAMTAAPALAYTYERKLNGEVRAAPPKPPAVASKPVPAKPAPVPARKP